MRTIYFLFFVSATVLFTAPKAKAQSLIVDTTIHIGYHDAVNDMILTETGDCILVGKFDTDSLTPKNIWVRRFTFVHDTVVSMVWEKMYYPSNSSRVSKAAWLQDGNIMISGSWNNNNMLLKMSPEGDSLDMVLLPGTSDTYIKDFIELPNTDLVVLMVDVDDDLYGKLMRITASGDEVWNEEFFEYYVGALAYFNPDTFMTGGYEYHQEYQHVLYGARQPEGPVLYNNMFQEHYGFINTMAADSAYLYLGNKKEYVTSPTYVSQVIKMTPQGEEEWNVDFSGIGSEMIDDIDLYDNYLLTFSRTPSSLIIGGITYDGVLAATYTVPKSAATSVDIESYDTTVLITGRFSNGLNGKDVYLMKFILDSLFIISDVPELVSDIPVTAVYPNPADDRIYIQVSNADAARLSSITLFDLMGREVLSIGDNLRGLSGIRVGHLENGMYVLLLSFENAAPVTQKILITH